MTNWTIASNNSQFYDDFWKEWPENATPSELDRATFITRALSRYVKKRDNRILDFGCGRGWLAPFLTDWGEVIAVDFSERGIQFAVEHYSRSAEFRVITSEKDVEELVPSYKFDVVICSEVIEHVEDHGAFLRYIHSVICLNGWCILTTPNGRLWSLWRDSPGAQRFLQPVENWLSPQQLADIAKDCGFEVRCQIGGRSHSFRRGGRLSRYLQHRRIGHHLERGELYWLYRRLIMQDTLYQYVLLQAK